MSRGGISFDGIGVRYVTYLLDDDITEEHEGAAVALVSDAMVGLGSANDRLFGKVLKVEGDGKGSIKDHGYATFEYSGSAPTVDSVVVVDGSGKVKASAGATGNARVVAVDTAAKTVVVLLG